MEYVPARMKGPLVFFTSSPHPKIIGPQQSDLRIASIGYDHVCCICIWLQRYLFSPIISELNDNGESCILI